MRSAKTVVVGQAVIAAIGLIATLRQGLVTDPVGIAVSGQLAYGPGRVVQIAATLVDPEDLTDLTARRDVRAGRMTAQRPDDVTDAEKVDAFGWGLSGYSQHHIVAGIPGQPLDAPDRRAKRRGIGGVIDVARCLRDADR